MKTVSWPRWLTAQGAIGGGLAAGVLFVAGCNLIPPPTPDPTRYYVLTGPALGAAGSGLAVARSVDAWDLLKCDPA